MTLCGSKRGPSYLSPRIRLTLCRKFSWCAMSKLFKWRYLNNTLKKCKGLIEQLKNLPSSFQVIFMIQIANYTLSNFTNKIVTKNQLRQILWFANQVALIICIGLLENGESGKVQRKFDFPSGVKLFTYQLVTKENGTCETVQIVMATTKGNVLSKPQYNVVKTAFICWHFFTFN